MIVAAEGQPDLVLSEHRACHHCGISFPEPTPQLFSFNSPQGMCPECSGLGTRMEMDPDLVVPNPELSVNEGAVKPLGAVGEATTWGSDIVRAVARERGIDLNKPWKALSGGAPPGDPLRHRRRAGEHPGAAARGASGAFKMRYEGAINSMMRRMRETKSEEMRQYYQKYLSSRPCSACEGRRIRPEALGREDRRAGRSPRSPRSRWRTPSPSSTGSTLKGAEAKIATELLKEIRSRLRFLLDVGLTYLTLDRAAPSLSGGESQRIRLASQIGSELTGVIYVLDEPSIGLHQRDNKKLLAALKHLRDIGNTVVVVEHDHEAMEEADWLVDFGPGAGRHGGEIVAAGTPAQVMKSKASLTGRYLRGDLRIEIPAERRKGDGRKVTVAGARENNLKDVDRVLPPGPLRVRDRRLRRGQEHPRQPHPLPRDRAGPPRERPAGGGARRGSTASARSTRSSTSTRARSGGPRARTRPPTPSSSTSSATSSPSCPRRGCTATPRAASPST